ncbi:LysR family transcriptional regulator [Acetobacterium wieringae]|uniref:LysR family transcriptional regulator n=1 Tax=Acetobacterium wieringae TaxID=52694 RepID=A0ABY6HEU5_9FIRM|nr:LysR family transcriptional regulator [Acetobacterium wieringae]UYO62897.1 LysR family transcriptional regulator [Acetobacterium wieringae]VUZ26702.1 HTH-type transcriptional regulator CynR [Acetobacterium wieringae]
MKDNRFKKVCDMIELKQLKYFVVCADVGSFSKAAEILYTTQPNVSKAIKALEEHLGFSLFHRKSRGILLSSRGKHVYEYACKAIDNIEMLASFSQTDRIEQLQIASNPSAWMAKVFADFYNRFHVKQLHFELYTASVAEIIKRVAGYQDELGFVYVMDSQNTAFQYILTRNHLEFVELKKTQVVLYLGQKHPLYQAREISEAELQKLKLVQCYEDEFDLNNYWKITNPQGKDMPALESVVVTNSDCVMQQLLQTTDLANISSGYLTDDVDEKELNGIPLFEKENVVMFGYIRRRQEEHSEWGKRFLEFIMANLQSGDPVKGQME